MPLRASATPAIKTKPTANVFIDVEPPAPEAIDDQAGRFLQF